MSSEETIVIGRDATTRTLLCSAFARQGLRARAALDGVAALELCRQRPPNTVIVESNAEGLSLTELLAALRTQTRLCRIGVILLGSEPSPDPGQRIATLPLPVFGKDVVSLSRFMSVDTLQGVLPLGDYNVLSFVRALHAAQIQCQLIFRRPPPSKIPEAHLTITHRSISCRAGHLQGKSALNRITVWRRAQVIWRLDAPQTESPPEELLDASAFTEAAQYLAEVQSLLSAMPPDDIPLVLHHEKRPPASKVPGEVNTILSLCGAGMSLDALLEEVPFRVLDSLRILRRLFDMGILSKPTASSPKSAYSGEYGEEPVRVRPIVVLTRPPGEPVEEPSLPRSAWPAPSVQDAELAALEERVARALEEDGDELDERPPVVDSSFEEFETPQIPVSTVTVANFETPQATVRVVSKQLLDKPLINLEREYQSSLDDEDYRHDTPVEGVPLPPKTRRWKLTKKK